MNYLSALEQQDNITIADVLNTAQQLLAQYLPMLERIVDIQTRLPVHEDEPVFRNANATKSAVPQLYEMLKKFQQGVFSLEKVLTRAQQGSVLTPEYVQLEAQVQEKFLKMLAAAIKHGEAIYAQHSQAFASILGDLRYFNTLLALKMQSGEAQNIALENNPITSSASIQPFVLAEDEKLVFVRVFNRAMTTLGMENAQLQWIKPLLESVKQAEKHGMAIYEEEIDAMKSLKGDAYGYVTIKIKKSQDISAQRPAKSDPNLGCKLLTITQVDIDNMIKLTHQSVEYLIQDGMLRKLVTA